MVVLTLALALLATTPAPAPPPEVPPPFERAGRRFEPAREPDLLVIDTATYRLDHFQRGVHLHTLDVALGQAVGPKQQRGDLKTPHGVYFVIDKHRGAFSGAFGAYYGGHWLKLNYPGPDDAARGEAAGTIDRATRTRIERAWRDRKATPQKTALGGGIGFHGWIEEWDGSDRHLSWGCIVLHLRDVAAFFDRVPVGTMVVIR